MKSKTYKSIVAKINLHIKENSYLQGNNHRWYVGITNDVKRRKAEHEARETIHHFASYYAYTAKIASEIEDYFSRKGTANNVGSRGANENSRWVYVFKIDFFNF
jgi:hypothetical protein